MKCPFVIKICTKCKRMLVAYSGNFNKAKGKKYGLCPLCKKCSHKKEKEGRLFKKLLKEKGNPFDNVDVDKVWNHCPFCIKVCSKCERILVSNELNFNRAKRGKYGLENECKECKKKYRELHRDENIEYQKEYYEKNKDKHSEYQKNYKKNNKEKISKNRKRYYIDNKERTLKVNKEYREKHKKEISKQHAMYYQENKEIIKERVKEYAKENPDKTLNGRVKRRMREENQGNGITKEQWLEMMNFFEFRCAYSGKYIGGDSEYRTIDHIVPLNNGGKHEVWNCVPMYANYNYSKNAKNMEDWYMKQDFFDINRLLKIYEWIEYAYNKYNNK